MVYNNDPLNYTVRTVTTIHKVWARKTGNSTYTLRVLFLIFFYFLVLQLANKKWR